MLEVEPALSLVSNADKESSELASGEQTVAACPTPTLEIDAVPVREWGYVSMGRGDFSAIESRCMLGLVSCRVSAHHS